MLDFSDDGRTLYLSTREGRDKVGARRHRHGDAAGNGSWPGDTEADPQRTVVFSGRDRPATRGGRHARLGGLAGQ